MDSGGWLTTITLVLSVASVVLAGFDLKPIDLSDEGTPADAR